jgi:GntR family transcriptional regulator
MLNLSQKESGPLYSRLATIIQNKIMSGQYEAGERLPTEDELAQNFGVSKITVRNALSILETGGLITRGRGKGTFVADAIPEIKQSIYTSLIGMVMLSDSHITPLEIKTIKIRESRIPKDICTFFQRGYKEDISRIIRLVTRKNVSYYYEYYLLPDMAQYITKKDLAEKKSIQAILQEKIGLRYGKGEMFLQAIPAEPDISDFLKCQAFEPLMYTQTYFWSEDEKPFGISNRYFRAYQFKYKIDVDLSQNQP